MGRKIRTGGAHRRHRNDRRRGDMAGILVVEDDVTTNDLVSDYLIDAGTRYFRPATVWRRRAFFSRTPWN